MDFGLDEAQQAVADLAASVLRGVPDDARVRAALASAGGYDEAAWKAMGQAGLLGLAIPEALGGDGLGPLPVGLVLAEVGRQVLPLPALATLALGVLPLVRHGTVEQHELLGDVANGALLTGALRDAPGAGVRVAGGVLTGVRIGVPYAEQARRILVPTAAGTAVVDAATVGVALQRTSTSTGAPEYTVRLDAVRPESMVDASAADLDRFAVAGAAAVADGVLAGALALTAEHLRTRQQFGRPLATFQAVAQQVADVYIAARTVHLAATSAAWRLDAGLPADEDLAVAAYCLAAEVPNALQVCHHLHGGLGVDITYPLHRYYSHAKDLARFVGGTAYRLDRLGA
ncbi:MAG TPA: acyl-CoA dehydrogenase family protein [Jatrophihabitans sp.]|nr:acyl-CoA dehydrogenase family protein [Jatrophihabitans sp.]